LCSKMANFMLCEFYLNEKCFLKKQVKGKKKKNSNHASVSNISF
jgi:hypothetical protein